MPQVLKWHELWHVYCFHRKTKVFSWMVAARNKNEAKLKTIHALAAYYPDIRVSDFMMTFKKDEAEVLV